MEFFGTISIWKLIICGYFTCWVYECAQESLIINNQVSREFIARQQHNETKCLKAITRKLEPIVLNLTLFQNKASVSSLRNYGIHIFFPNSYL